MTKLIQATRRHPRRWGVLLALGALALVLAGSLISTRDVTAQPDGPQGQQAPPSDITPASVTPFQTFSTNTDLGTRVVVSTHGNVIEFNSPNTAGADYEHIGVGAVYEGYSVCYTPIGGTRITAYDNASQESGWGAATTLTGPVRVNRSTSDGRLQLNQTFTFNGQGKSLTIKMVLKNTSGARLDDIRLRRLVDFDVDSGGDNQWAFYQNWHSSTVRDSVSAWNGWYEAALADYKEGHGMTLRHLTPPMASLTPRYYGPGSHYTTINNFSDMTSCFPPPSNAPPSYGDLTESLVHVIGSLNAGASKTITIQYLRD
jgi:hypothetical protein